MIHARSHLADNLSHYHAVSRRPIGWMFRRATYQTKQAVKTSVSLMMISSN